MKTLNVIKKIESERERQLAGLRKIIFNWAEQDCSREQLLVNVDDDGNEYNAGINSYHIEELARSLYRRGYRK